MKAGDTICLRAGNYSDQSGYDNRFIRFRSHNGSAPTSTAGTGPISITSHPGTILGHAPEYAHFTDPAAGGGGIHGVNTAYSGTYGQWVNISGLHLQCNATSVSDSGPVAMQAGANNWRIVDNELGPWPSTTTGANDARSGGISGQGNGVKILFNYIHDIAGDPAQLQNHGMYIGDAANLCSKNVEIAYNWVLNSVGGSTLQFNNVAATDTFSGINIHHNFLDTCAKYSVNLSNSVISMDIWDNIIINPSKNAWRVGNLTASATINVLHNTIRQVSSNSAYASVFANESSSITTGTWKFQHNTIVIAGTSVASFVTFGTADTALALNTNLFFDETGTLTTAPTLDATGIYGNPQFSNITNKDFTTTASGAGFNAATFGTPALTVNTDLYGIARPQGGISDIGATEGAGT